MQALLTELRYCTSSANAMIYYDGNALKIGKKMTVIDLMRSFQEEMQSNITFMVYQVS